jgi:hypothetical protein
MGNRTTWRILPLSAAIFLALGAFAAPAFAQDDARYCDENGAHCYRVMDLRQDLASDPYREDVSPDEAAPDSYRVERRDPYGGQDYASGSDVIRDDGDAPRARSADLDDRDEGAPMICDDQGRHCHGSAPWRSDNRRGGFDEGRGQ